MQINTMKIDGTPNPGVCDLTSTGLHPNEEYIEQAVAASADNHIAIIGRNMDAAEGKQFLTVVINGNIVANALT